MTEVEAPAVVLEGVTRSFGKKEVLRGVTGDLAPGSVVGILGRNGEGKTTLFHILLDMLEADSGRVEVLGLRPDWSGEIRQRAGYVPERPTFHEFMSIGEVFALRERFFRGWDQDKALGLAKRLGLDPSTPIRGASKGTLAKIAWVCAVAHDPALLLLDEPTSGLDALVRDDILGDLIGELSDSGKTILVANHHMEELAAVLDELWVLSNGRIAGVYDMERLRSQSCLVTGRLRDGLLPPPGLPLVQVKAEGKLVQWAAFDRTAVERLASCGAVEDLDSRGLPIEKVFALLLKEG